MGKTSQDITGEGLTIVNVQRAFITAVRPTILRNAQPHPSIGSDEWEELSSMARKKASLNYPARSFVHTPHAPLMDSSSMCVWSQKRIRRVPHGKEVLRPNVDGPQFALQYQKQKRQHKYCGVVHDDGLGAFLRTATGETTTKPPKDPRQSQGMSADQQ